MNLLLITQEDKQHYVLIKDFNKLMYKKNETSASKTFLHALFTVFFFRKCVK